MNLLRHFVVAASAAACLASANEPAAPTVESLDRDTYELSTQLQSVQKQLDDLEQRLSAVEARLGNTYKPTTPFNTIERRLEDLEDDADRSNRR